ncbi:YceI family protein [Winogradskyella echinorum]|uniref:YceI family protein n=1 Tax=Winogradskyella echinorum TaxID=538189 RepID=A0ABR6Y0X0_9FLAO|nr:YceI family protein [Winogradskyella echinorum]MBC3846377.1 YceI family protein [Winogradskyella echinorum]MBC5750725.1 YceI family protein [Winogradskyella echinorum]
MKKRTLLALIALVLIANSYAQKKEIENLEIDIKKSELKWSGEYAFYFGGHNGTISFKEGYFIKSNNVITGGEFIIDMNSIMCDDIEDNEANESLVNHLKNEDFFNVKEFKTAKLVITSVDYHNDTQMKVNANLTIKGITLPVNFQAEVNYEKQQMTSKFKIDRQRWGIDYNSKLRDGAISDGIGFEVILSL